MRKKMAALPMVDLHLPTTDGRDLILSRCPQPEKDQKRLLSPLKLELPAQPPPQITADGTTYLEPVTVAGVPTCAARERRINGLAVFCVELRKTG